MHNLIRSNYGDMMLMMMMIMMTVMIRSSVLCIVEIFSCMKTNHALFYNPNNESLINLLKSTGHVMHQQFNIQQLYALPTLYLCVLYLSENKQQLVPLTA